MFIGLVGFSRQSGETMTSVSVGFIILTSTQSVGSGRPQRESNPGPPHPESGALPTELPRPPRNQIDKSETADEEEEFVKEFKIKASPQREPVTF